jgi:uncharacterized coiled-coil DUF342 family protein
MTSPSEPRKRGRPLGVTNKTKRKSPVASTDLNKAKTELTTLRKTLDEASVEIVRLNEELKIAKSAFEGARLHIEKVEKQHKAALIVIGYLEGKIFTE